MCGRLARAVPQDDNNTGTYPLQSERFFAALKGHGAPARLVLLPHESHGAGADAQRVNSLTCSPVPHASM